MGRRIFTGFQIDFIKANYNKLLDREIAPIVGMTETQVCNFRKRNGLMRDPAVTKERMKLFMPKNSLFTKEQLEWFKAHNTTCSATELANGLNKRFGTSFTSNQIKTFRHNNHLPGGSDGRFKKGMVPATKGKTWDQFMSEEGKIASRRNWFKPGDTPANYCEVGTVMVKSDGYMWIKVSDSRYAKYPGENWKMYSRYLWEKEYGPIPKGKMLVFLNGDKLDVRLENMALMDLREKAFFRPFTSEDSDLAGLGVDIAKAKAKLYGPQRKECNGKE